MTDSKEIYGIKFFSKFEHKIMFDNNQLFTNPISYYRKNAKNFLGGW